MGNKKYIKIHIILKKIGRWEKIEDSYTMIFNKREKDEAYNIFSFLKEYIKYKLFKRG